MKKIFAIALALVMVLSMASAFAFCGVIDWSTTDACGMGSVEVVPYAVGNKVGGNSFTATDCAAAVNNQFVYFAVKVTVDANPNQDWWNNAKLTVSGSGLGALQKYDAASFGIADLRTPFAFDSAAANLLADNTYEAGTYYLTTRDWTTVKLSDSFDPATTLFAAKVTDAATAKVCATLKSVSDAKVGAVNINGYEVTVGPTGGTVLNKAYTWYLSVDNGVEVYFNGKDIVGVKGGINYYHSYCDGKFIGNDGISAAATCSVNVNDYTAIMGVFEALNINWNSKISVATAQAKLSKTDKVSDCATWSSDALAVVNPDCFVMEIPKTGDKSVLAWLF